MAIIVKSLQGRGYPLSTKTTLTQKISEEGTLEFDIIENASNYDLLNSITKMWTVTRVGGPSDIKEYRIVMLDKSSIGQVQTLHVKAKEREIDDLSVQRIYETYSGSFTGKKYFDMVFHKSGYKYKLKDKVNASSFENVGEGDTRLELFKKGLDRYTLEYEYDEKTKTFTLQTSIKNSAKYFIDSRVNANNIKIEEDATQAYTFIKGFGDYEDDGGYSTAGLIMEYTHPLADVLGKREAPPVMDGRVKKQKTMDAMLKSTISESIKTSLSLDFVTLPEHYKEAEPKPGDIVRVRDNLTGLNDDARIVEVKTERDPFGKITKQEVVFGDFRLREKYMKNLNNAAKYVNGLGGLNTSNATKNSRLTSEKIGANSKATANIIDSTSSLNFNMNGISTKGGKGGVALNKDGLYVDPGIDGNEPLLIADENGLNTEAIPKATTTKDGLMSSEDKKKLENIKIDSLVMKGTDGKNYKITINNSEMNIAEV
ncbi:hypothetical protein BU065_01300 [Staphylococcus succinus]|uniref:tail tube TT1 domain-containing protein n=1 Tax=Staphylococcus succinus TaxID=61015 RepID=UPI000E676D03|nr:phage tail protein [Staphylococcus succinus]RIN37039.1 hypothetical protein BU065_01300 [Staphylococcus succinus]